MEKKGSMSPSGISHAGSLSHVYQIERNRALSQNIMPIKARIVHMYAIRCKVGEDVSESLDQFPSIWLILSRYGKSYLSTYFLFPEQLSNARRGTIALKCG